MRSTARARNLFRTLARTKWSVMSWGHVGSVCAHAVGRSWDTVPTSVAPLQNSTVHRSRQARKSQGSWTVPSTVRVLFAGFASRTQTACAVTVQPPTFALVSAVSVRAPFDACAEDVALIGV